MRRGSDAGVETGAGTEPALTALLARLRALALGPAFELQRRQAVGLALRPYAEYGPQFGLAPLPEEEDLAQLYVDADYLPDDGQPSLIEQVRDTITTHVPEEERAWLDPVRHSNMDVLEVTARPHDGRLALRSLGSGKTMEVEAGRLVARCREGQVLLARVVRRGDRTVVPGAALVLSASAGRALFEGVDEWRRSMEVETGSFELAEWEEFAKRFGHVLLWRFAQVRLEALARAEMRMQFRAPDGTPCLYALALYEHHAHPLLSKGLAKLEGWTRKAGGSSVEQWMQPGADGRPAARATLTPTQLFVECDGGASLDRVKHQFASAFGFSLHYCGESTKVPPHGLRPVSLEEEEPAPGTVVVTREAEQEILTAFLETVYMEWADRPSPSLDGQTPRHAAGDPKGRRQVAALIQALEREDPGMRRTGTPGYDYGRLRAHVGL